LKAVFQSSREIFPGDQFQDEVVGVAVLLDPKDSGEAGRIEGGQGWRGSKGWLPRVDSIK